MNESVQKNHSPFRCPSLKYGTYCPSIKPFSIRNTARLAFKKGVYCHAIHALFPEKPFRKSPERVKITLRVASIRSKTEIPFVINFYCLVVYLHAISRRLPCAFGCVAVGWGNDILMERRLLSALFLAAQNFATFEHGQEWSNGRCSRGM